MHQTVHEGSRGVWLWPVPRLPYDKEANMENQNNARGDATSDVCVRNLNLYGQRIADFVVERVREDRPHASAEALAIVFEAVAGALSAEAEVLCRRGIR